MILLVAAVWAISQILDYKEKVGHNIFEIFITNIWGHGLFRLQDR